MDGLIDLKNLKQIILFLCGKNISMKMHGGKMWLT